MDLAQNSDVVIIIGGANSNNTRELVKTSLEFCDRVHHIQSPDDLCEDWFDGVETVGLTAGTSTPDWIVDAVETRLKELAEASERKEASPRAAPPAWTIW